MSQPGDGGAVMIEVNVSGEGATDDALERVVQRLAAEPGLLRVRGQTIEDI